LIKDFVILQVVLGGDAIFLLKPVALRRRLDCCVSIVEKLTELAASTKTSFKMIKLSSAIFFFTLFCAYLAPFSFPQDYGAFFV
jgi:hypothetical protein